MPWSKRFFEPITLPDGRELKTLRDAAAYITKLPKAEQADQRWQAATRVLLLVAKVTAPK